MALETALGGPDKMAYRVGVTGHSCLLAAQLMRLREHNEEAWRRTNKVGTVNTLFDAIFHGSWNISAEDAWLSGMWNVGSAKSSGNGSANGENTPPVSIPNWDKNASDYVAGGSVEGQHLRDSLGEVEMNPRTRSRPITRYWTDRYGFDPGKHRVKRSKISAYYRTFLSETRVATFLPPSIATYLSVAPGRTDGILQFGHTDIFMAPTTLESYRLTRLCSLIPHPAASPQSRRWIGLMTSTNAETPRMLVKDMYTKTWSAFDRLVAIVPPGGSIG
jgi:xylulokinase